LAGLRSALVTHNFPDLPNDLDKQFLDDSKMGLQHRLRKEWKDWLRNNHDKIIDGTLEVPSEIEFKIAKVKRLLKKFKDGTIQRKWNCRENWWAAQLVLFELNGNKAIKEATT